MVAHIPVPETSLNEKDRRWSLLRDTLKEAGLSALIVYGGTQLISFLERYYGQKGQLGLQREQLAFEREKGKAEPQRLCPQLLSEI